ncbi:MAG: hypothetical protein HYT78_04670 [Deltaproteobacteria bacterium]|nr:hypothetical protein [Deltaproteobacteria bacterium]
MRTRKARPERFRISLRDEAGGTPLPLPSRRMWPVGLVFGVVFLIFAGIAWSQIASMRGHQVKSVFDLVAILFQGFWVLAWSVGVFILGALAVLFFFYGESARLRDGRLIQTPRLGPLRISVEYNLAKIRSLRLERASGHRGDLVQIRFNYGDGTNGLGDVMPRLEAEKLIALIREAVSRVPRVEAEEIATPGAGQPAKAPSRALATAPPSLTSPSTLALIGANLTPLAGVWFLGWHLGEVMVLFWAESAVIGFWNVIKLGIVGKWAALLAAPFFVGHFGGFMAGHFLFIYYFFVRGIGAAGPEPAALAALLDLFVPLWPALAALFISHGISFFTNYLARREYLGMDLKTQMSEPYKRIIVMHITIIIGGFLTMVLQAPEAALLLLIALKTATDLSAHRKEHARQARTDA